MLVGSKGSPSNLYSGQMQAVVMIICGLMEHVEAQRNTVCTAPPSPPSPVHNEQEVPLQIVQAQLARRRVRRVDDRLGVLLQGQKGRSICCFLQVVLPGRGRP